MRPRFSCAILALFAVLLLSQFIRPSRTNPPVDESRTIRAWTALSPEVRQILERSCYDCHSYNTVWPWYSNVAPASWLLARDVRQGRGGLNLSDWEKYDPKLADRKLKQICEEVRSGDMPPWSYVPLHPKSKLSAVDKRTVCEWTEAERARLSRASAP